MKFKVGDEVLYNNKECTIFDIDESRDTFNYELKKSNGEILGWMSEESICPAEKVLDRATEQRQQDTNRISEHIEEVKMGDLEAIKKTEYEKGLNDAWNLIRRLRTTDPTDLIEIFDKYATYSIVEELSASEAVAKWKAWEEKNKIEVGDEIILNANANHETVRAIVLTYYGSAPTYNVLTADGNTECVKEHGIKCKTGRHFDEILEVLNQLQKNHT